MEHVPFIIKNTSQKVIEFSLSDYLDSNNYATWRFSADRDISSIDWEAVKDYEEINTIAAIPIYDDIVGKDPNSGLEEGYSEKTFRLMPGEAISLRNVGEVGAVCNPHFNIVDKGLTFDGSLLSLLPGGKMTEGCFERTFSDCIGLTETPSFSDISEVPKDAFSQMFKGCTSLKNAADMPNAKKLGVRAFSLMYYGCKSLTEMAACPKVDIIPDYCFDKTYAYSGIKEMKPLPASIVGFGAYNSMFLGCTSLEKASEIAATEFGEFACDGMYLDCTSLKNTANMPNVKKLSKGAFSAMYLGCKSLTEVADCPNVDIIPFQCFFETYANSGVKYMKPLPASKVGRNAYAGMFDGCKSLEKASEIAATEFGEGACHYMFAGCTSLKNAADMPNAKELDEYAFSLMYSGCTSLTEMKPLPASKVGRNAYAGMFEGCTNLENASEIAAKEFGEGACDRMFKDCTSLKKPANMPNCQNTFKDMYAGCPLQPVTKKSKTKGSKAKLKHPILTQGKAKGQSKGNKMR